jgi:hypothetical protein
MKRLQLIEFPFVTLGVDYTISIPWVPVNQDVE